MLYLPALDGYISARSEHDACLPKVAGTSNLSPGSIQQRRKRKAGSGIIARKPHGSEVPQRGNVLNQQRGLVRLYAAES